MAAPAAAQCLGDFDGDGHVTVDEIIVAVQNGVNDCRLTGPRFLDNGDGTVSDRATGLMWERKDGADGSPDAADLHDVDDTFSWSSVGGVPDGTLFTVFLAALNGAASADGISSTGCFANHCDWRLPRIEELAGIVDPTQSACQEAGPCIDPSFGATQSDGYWSASTFAHAPAQAWIVDFSAGARAHGAKSVAFFVRAVR